MSSGRSGGFKMSSGRSNVDSSNELLSLLEDIQALNRDASIAAKIKRCHDIVAGKDAFIEQNLSEESELRQKIVQDTLVDPKASPLSRMLSGHFVGQLVKVVAEMVQAKRVLEIGMFTGYGTVTMGESAFCEEVVSLDISKYMEVFVKERIKGTPLENKIRIILGPANNSLVSLKEEGSVFDMVFIDADKEGYLHYYQYIMDNGLLSSKGVILCDNILWYNDTFLDKKTTGGQALNEFVKFVKRDNRVDQIIFPIRDGVMLIKPKRYPLVV